MNFRLPSREISLVFIAALLCPAAVPADSYKIPVYRDGAPVWIEREVPTTAGPPLVPGIMDQQLTERVSGAFQALVAGPGPKEKAEGLSGIAPTGSVLDNVEIRDGYCTVSLTLPDAYLKAGISDDDMEMFARASAGIAGQTAGLKSLAIVVRAPGEVGYRLMSERAAPRPPQVRKPESESPKSDGDSSTKDTTSRAGQPPSPGLPQPSGALSGASVFLSPGHGWYYSSTLSRWATQRGNTNQIIEDMSNAEAVLQYLERYLWNAGARTYTVRERDLNTNMVIVDNTAASLTGSWTLETIASAYGGSLRYASTVTGSATATATYTPNIPAAGNYAVYVWYRTSGGGTTTNDARITVNHTGGSTVWTQNQNQDGYTWKYIGTYYFDAGSSAANGSVTINNLSSTAGNRVIADAVRFGGGMGDMPDNVSSTISGKPRWEESGRYFAGFMGKSDWASYGTVAGMPNYAKWEKETWEDGRSVYVSWHTNAPNPGTGTETYAYSSAGWDGAFSGVAGGDTLRNYIHNELINDIRAGYDAGWSNRGTHTADFGELNPTNNNAMPAALTEIAFHDTPADAAKLADPEFRRICARAVYQGIVKFYNNNYPGTFPSAALLPEPPTTLRVIRAGATSVNLSWSAPPYNTGNNLLGDAATGYKVYRSTNGKGFDNGTVLGNVLTTTISGLTAGQVYYFRVTATNAGGESFPTEVLAASCYTPGANPVLIVNGFDRIDAAANIVEADPYSANPLQRGYLWRMNTYDYIIAHAQAVKNYGRDFDSCSNEAVRDGQVNLNNYNTVIWILGEESSVDKTFEANERTAVQNFLAAGKNLFISGSEVAYELDNLNVARTFYNSTLRASFASDSAGSYDAQGATGSIFNGISLTFDNGVSIYNVNSPDVITPMNGAISAMTYPGAGSTLIDGLDSVSGWWDPNDSGSTHAGVDAASAFTLASSPVRQGTGSGNLYYVWGTGTFIREYDANQPQFPANSTLSLWVYGDNSGNQVRLCIRDLEASPGPDLFVSNYVTINFTGWQKITWQIGVDPTTKWAGTGDGLITGANVKFDSIHVNKGGSSPASGNLYFDEIAYTTTGGGGGTAAIQYSGTGKLVNLAFPFETITSSAQRNAVMNAALDFFGTPTPVGLSEFLVE